MMYGVIQHGTYSTLNLRPFDPDRSKVVFLTVERFTNDIAVYLMSLFR